MGTEGHMFSSLLWAQKATALMLMWEGNSQPVTLCSSKPIILFCNTPGEVEVSLIHSTDASSSREQRVQSKRRRREWQECFKMLCRSLFWQWYDIIGCRKSPHKLVNESWNGRFSKVEGKNYSSFRAFSSVMTRLPAHTLISSQLVRSILVWSQPSKWISARPQPLSGMTLVRSQPIRWEPLDYNTLGQ